MAFALFLSPNPYNASMQTIQGKIEQLREQVSKLLEEIEILEKAKELLGPTESGRRARKRLGRPKGSKNKTVASKRRSRKAAKKSGEKRAKGRGRKSAAVTETPAES